METWKIDLIDACKKGNYERVDFISSLHMGTELDYRTNYAPLKSFKPLKSFTPLVTSIKSGYYNIVKLLINRGASLSPIEDLYPLVELTTKEDYDLDTLIFFLNNGSDVNETGLKNYTPLHNVCYDCRYDVAKELLRRGANVNAKTITDFTPIMNCVGSPHFYLDFFWLMIENGSDTTFTDEDGDSIYEYAKNDKNLLELHDFFRIISRKRYNVEDSKLLLNRCLGRINKSDIFVNEDDPLAVLEKQGQSITIIEFTDFFRAVMKKSIFSLMIEQERSMRYICNNVKLKFATKPRIYIQFTFHTKKAAEDTIIELKSIGIHPTTTQGYFSMHFMEYIKDKSNRNDISGFIEKSLQQPMDTKPYEILQNGNKFEIHYELAEKNV